MVLLAARALAISQLGERHADAFTDGIIMGHVMLEDMFHRRPSVTKGIDDHVGDWHEGHGVGHNGHGMGPLPLHDYLGLTWLEYGRWVETSTYVERTQLRNHCENFHDLKPDSELQLVDLRLWHERDHSLMHSPRHRLGVM